MPDPFIIAIDGHSSCGKSTLAKAIADKLGFIYIDSGAMYRAVTLYFLQNNIDLADSIAVTRALDQLVIDLRSGDSGLTVWLNGKDISEDIRQMPVSNLVSKVSAIPAVRHKMVGLQQEMGRQKNIVMDGRDIGTVVFPRAPLKIFMTARPEIRARRRYKELQAKGLNVSLEDIHENLLKRDLEDTTRAESPLVKADDAIILDNSYMNREEQLDWIMEKIKGKLY